MRPMMATLCFFSFFNLFYEAWRILTLTKLFIFTPKLYFLIFCRYYGSAENKGTGFICTDLLQALFFHLYTLYYSC